MTATINGSPARPIHVNAGLLFFFFSVLFNSKKEQYLRSQFRGLFIAQGGRMFYILLEEETPEDWTASYASGAVPEGEEFDVILHSVSRYGVYTVIKTNTPYWAVGSTITVRKP